MDRVSEAVGFAISMCLASKSSLRSKRLDTHFQAAIKENGKYFLDQAGRRRAGEKALASSLV